jgi:hypothetical protein
LGEVCGAVSDFPEGAGTCEHGEQHDREYRACVEADASGVAWVGYRVEGIDEVAYLGGVWAWLLGVGHWWWWPLV